MEIILLKQVKSLGGPGDIKEVKSGYALNYLIPAGFALPAKEGYIKEAQARVRKLLKKVDLELEALKEVLGELNGLQIVIYKKTGKDGKLFGSVKAKDIIGEIAAKINKTINEKYVSLKEPIKKIGEYEISIKVGEGEAKIKLMIKEEKTIKKGKK